MIERFLGRAERLAQTRVRLRRRQLAALLEGALPEDILAEEVEEGVTLTGRALAVRFARDAELRWLLAGLAR
jgi:hypothetical protein